MLIARVRHQAEELERFRGLDSSEREEDERERRGSGSESKGSADAMCNLLAPEGSDITSGSGEVHSNALFHNNIHRLAQ